MLFKYTGIDKEGKKVRSKIEAYDMVEAKKKLKVQQVLLMSIKEEKVLFDGELTLFKRAKKISPKDLSTISRDLAIYIQAGVSLVNAIRLIANQYAANKTLNIFFNTVKTFLDEGKNFYQALDLQTVIKLPVFYKQSIKVSENSGILDEVLLELSKFLKNQDRLNKRLSNAFAYPMFIMIVSVFMVAFMMSVVVPKITTIFDQLDQELPPISQFTIGISAFITDNFVAILSLCTIGISVFIILLKWNKQFKYGVDRVLLKVPFFGKLIESSELARFSYMISILMRSGVSFVQSINLSAKIVNNAVIGDIFENASNKVVEGSKFSSILLKAPYRIDNSFIQAISLGEETSELTQILKNLASLYEEDSKDKIEMFLSLLEPFLMLVVGGIIGFIVVSMLLPIFSMNIG